MINFLSHSTGKAHVGLVIVIIAFAAAYTFVSGNPCGPNPNIIGQPCQAPSTITAVPNPNGNNATDSAHSIQLKNIDFSTPTPLPVPTSPLYTPPTVMLNPTGINSCNDERGCGTGGVCHPHEHVPSCASCCATEACIKLYDTGPFHVGPNSQYHCDAKPVIYLYPLHQTIVNVRIDVPGKIVVSNPHYPINGWQNVIAQPDGTFTYNNKVYSELFYEAMVKTNIVPQGGKIVRKQDAYLALEQLTSQLGLNSIEQKELIEFWVPKIQSFSDPYFILSVYSSLQKEKFDHVTISPKPDTFIQFILYFKPIKSPIPMLPLLLSPPPERLGFTAVEWGGIIDN